MPLGDASMVIDTILSELEKDPVGCVDSFSPSGLWLLNIEQSCSTGCAISVASSLLEITYPQSPSHIMMFIGGPCTSGPGPIVETDLSETIRAHHRYRA